MDVKKDKITLLQYYEPLLAYNSSSKMNCNLWDGCKFRPWWL